MARPGTHQGRKLKILFLVLLLLGGFILFETSCFASCGGSPTGVSLERIRTSPQFNGEVFKNPVMGANRREVGTWGMIEGQFFGDQQRVPPGPLPVDFPDPTAMPERPADGLRAIWFGHSSVLIEIDGVRVFTDPVFSQRVSPFKHIGPQRFHPPPIPLEELPPIHAVVISHDHYDHLDQKTAEFLTKRGTTYFVPVGIGAHLRAWGVADEAIVELDWGQSRTIAGGRSSGEIAGAVDAPDGVTIHCTPAVHYSGRGLFNKDSTLWSSWTLVGPRHRLFYSGDTGYSEHFERIGAEFGPFDLTVIKVGSYDDTWNNIHMLPESAVQAHLDLNGKRMLGTHWATFDMAWHDWDEPIRRTAKAAREKEVELVTPRLGEKMDVGRPFENEDWWSPVNEQ